MWSNPRLAPLLRNGISLRYKKRSMIEEGEDFNFYLLTSWLCAGPVLVDFRWARNLLREDFFEQLLFAIFFFFDCDISCEYYILWSLVCPFVQSYYFWSWSCKKKEILVFVHCLLVNWDGNPRIMAVSPQPQNPRYHQLWHGCQRATPPPSLKRLGILCQYTGK